MTVLFYRYGSICELDIINTFKALNMNVVEITTEITDKTISSSQRIQLLKEAIDNTHPLFVFSINFYPTIAEVCHIYKIFYLCWTVDSPVLELFSPSIQRATNRIFLFDYAQYQDFHPYNESGIFHLPLAACTERFDKVIDTITTEERAKYSCDISFVGSLYSEKNPLRSLTDLPDYVIGYIDGMVDASLKVAGMNFMEQALTEEVMHYLPVSQFQLSTSENMIADPSRYIAAHHFIGTHAAEIERVRTLNELAKHFKVDLYTRSDTSPLQGVKVHGGVKTLTEMPKVFHLSKINLNMTIKPIQMGLPLRIFDIMGCGGFLMTNYQAELPELFEIGVDLEAYGSLEELIDKCDYYLTHEEQRKQIALNGYRKVKEHHTYEKRIMEMLRIVTS